MATAPGIQSPHVEYRPGVCGGAAVVRGTRFPVRSVVEYVLRQGMTPEEVVAEWTFLSLAQVHGALAFYYDHRDEIEADIAANAAADPPPPRPGPG